MFQTGRSQAVLSSTSPKTPAFINSTDATIAGLTAVQQVDFRTLRPSYLELRVADSA